MLVKGDGTIEGYGARFNNADSHLDIIDKGAFADTIAQYRRAGRMPWMLLQHGHGKAMEDELPIGAWSHIEEDDKGLFMRGQLALGNRRADDVYALMRTEPPALNGLSIGYVCKRFTIMPKGASYKRRIHAVDLIEVSCVHVPSNDSARLTSVKGDASDAFIRALTNFSAALQ